MQKLTASGIPCNGICRVPEDRQRFRSESPRTDSRRQSAWHLLLPVLNSILAVVGNGQGNPTNPCLSWSQGYCTHRLSRNNTPIFHLVDAALRQAEPGNAQAVLLSG